MKSEFAHIRNVALLIKQWYCPYNTDIHRYTYVFVYAQIHIYKCNIMSMATNNVHRYEIYIFLVCFFFINRFVVQ